MRLFFPYSDYEFCFLRDCALIERAVHLSLVSHIHILDYCVYSLFVFIKLLRSSRHERTDKITPDWMLQTKNLM